MWGQVLMSMPLIFRARIIPTRVGTRVITSGQEVISQDHPHACGDKVLASLLIVLSVGSSPRVWGQASRSFAILPIIGIIPTRVGTSAKKYSKSYSYRDHPHACGDKCFSSCPLGLSLGSSPRVWGQDNFALKDDQYLRIIPTRVGTSYGIRHDSVNQPDHPHACGDK